MVWVGALSALQNVVLGLCARIIDWAAQNTPKHIARSHSDDTSTRHTRNGRWIETIGINVRDGQKVCCDGLDTPESMVFEVVFANVMLLGRKKLVNNQKGDNRHICVDTKKGMHVSEGGVDSGCTSHMICGSVSRIV